MADAKASASGPMWTMPEWMGHVSIVSCASRDALNEEYESAIPVRVLPGHGRYVPAELVEAIEKAVAQYVADSRDDRRQPGSVEGLAQVVYAAIRAAKEGEV